ncbi:MAG: YfhO family protein [Chloroflexi bacterium]|nr:YfhO family protein [Chloroflexota bacterium]
MAFSTSSQTPEIAYEELPAWMRKPRHEIDWPAILVIALAAVIAAPLLLQSGLSHSVGMQGLISRTVQMAQSIQADVLYPRWAPDFNYGYGSPLWNYLPPLPHYLTGMHHVLAQTSPELSIKMITALAVGLAGLEMLVFVRQRWGMYAGLLAAAAYLYSPQVAQVKPYLDGDLAGLLAMGLFPAALWALDRVRSGPGGWPIAWAALLLAALWLADTPLNLVQAVILLGWLGWDTLTRPEPRTGQWRIALAFGLSIALSAFFWLPALLERGDVRWEPISAELEAPASGLSLLEMLGQPALLDLSAINPVPTPAIGVALWVLTLAGVVLGAATIWRRSAGRWQQMRREVTPEQWQGLYFIVVGVLLVILATPPAARLWDALLPAWPGFDARDLLAVIVFCGAVGVGQLGHWAEMSLRPGYAALVTAGTLVLLVLAALPILAVPQPANIPQTEPNAIVWDEAGYAAASHYAGWLIPNAVRTVPGPSPALHASYQTGVVDKILRDPVPPAVQIDVIEHRPQSDRFAVSASTPVSLTVLTFYFPGWRARIDGNPAPIRVEQPSGFMLVNVPDGQHEVSLTFGSTRARNLGWIVAGVGLLGLALTIMHLERRGEAANERERMVGDEPVRHRRQLAPYLVFAWGFALFAASGLLVRLEPDIFTTESPRGVVLAAGHALPLSVQGGIELLGYDLEPDRSLSGGDRVDVTLYWRAARPNLPDYQVEVSLMTVDAPAARLVSARHRHPGMIPTSQWAHWPLLDYYIRDEYGFTLDRDTPPGTYQIVIRVGRCSQLSLFACNTMETLGIRDEHGASLGAQIVLPTALELRP